MLYVEGKRLSGTEVDGFSGGSFAGVGEGKIISLGYANGAGVNVDDVGMASSYALTTSSPLVFFGLTRELNSSPNPLQLNQILTPFLSSLFVC